MSDENKGVEFVNESGRLFEDISSEESREYTFPNGRTLVIRKPLFLNVGSNGGHRVFSSDGYSWYVRPSEGWYIRWKAKAGFPHFVK